MLQCKSCGVIFQGIYIEEQKEHKEFKSTLSNLNQNIFVQEGIAIYT